VLHRTVFMEPGVTSFISFQMLGDRHNVRVPGQTDQSPGEKFSY